MLRVKGEALLHVEARLRDAEDEASRAAKARQDRLDAERCDRDTTMHALLEEQRRLLERHTALDTERAEFDAERKKWLQEKDATAAALRAAAVRKADNEAHATAAPVSPIISPLLSKQAHEILELPRAEMPGIGPLSLSKLVLSASPEIPIEISDLMPQDSSLDTSVTAVADVLTRSMIRIRGAFLHYVSVYGAAHATATLTLEQFRLFVHDCGCSGGGEGQAAFDKIFRLSSLHQQGSRNSPKHVIGALSDSVAEASTSFQKDGAGTQRFVVVRRLGLSAFIESIVRLGVVECADPSVASSTANFLTNFVEKGAKVLKDDGLGKRLRSSADVAAVFEDHKPKLQALFSKLVAENERKMTSSRFTWLVQQCDFLKASITPPKTFQICCRATSERDATGWANIRCDLDYDAFLEALVRLEHACMCGDVMDCENMPLPELASRIHAFLTEVVYPPCLRKRIFSPPNMPWQ
jgi:hypothetical protein